MIRTFKLSTIALCLAAAAVSANAQTNLLQSVSVNFTVYTQGPTNISTSGTNYTVDHHAFGTKDLINILSSNGFQSGDVLARAIPVTNSAVTITNLVPVSTNVLVVSNSSTSLESVSNILIIGGSNFFIGDTNYSFSTNTETIGGSIVSPSNAVVYGSNSIFIGTNTTVTTTTFTNSSGYTIGSSNVFVINSFSNSVGDTTNLGAASWVIYNGHHGHPAITPISTNVTFDIHTRDVYDDGTNLAIVHGETVGKNHVIHFGTTDEIRTLTLSNSTWNVKLQGYSNGHYVSVSLGGGVTVYSSDYNWSGSGSGTSNSVPAVVEGNVSEQYFGILK